MKKALYYAIRPGRFGRPDMVAVTSERGTHWWGRTVSGDVGTHGRTWDIHGRFDDQAVAESRMARVQHINDHYSRQSAVLTDAQNLLSKHRDGHIKRAIEGQRSDLVEARALTQTAGDRDEVRDELARTLRRIATEGTAGLEIDAALDAVLGTCGVL